MRVANSLCTVGLSFVIAANAVCQGDNGTVKCWGFNTPEFPACNVPAELSGVQQIAAGCYFSFAVMADGTLTSWGANYYGVRNIPNGLNNVKQVSAGENYWAMALRHDGSVVAWGGQGGGTLPWSSLTGIIQIDAGSFALALRETGEVAAWGGDGQGESRGAIALSGITSVAAGSEFGVATKTDGLVVAWGSNLYGQSAVPFDLGTVRQVDAGSQYAMALRQNRTVVCWGRNDAGQRNVPPNLSGIREISAGGQHALALKDDGSVVAWGRNVEGQCNVPSTVTGVTQLAAGNNHSMALLGPRIAIQSVRPISGPGAGGTPITITGTNFKPGAKVRIRDVDATDVVVVSPTTITAVTPAGFPGEAEVSVDYGFATAFYYRPECGSDLDQDGEVTPADVSIVLLDFGPCYSQPGGLAAPAPTPQALPKEAQGPVKKN